ncbi:MAG: NHL repeat-containing protein [Thermomicrobiales bacterium]
MDIARLSRLRHILSSSADRRDLVRGLATIPFLTAVGLPLIDAEAAKRRHKAQADKKGKKKSLFCLNGQTVSAKNSKKKKKLRKQGATPGECVACIPSSLTTVCNGKCGQVVNNCGDLVDCGACCVPDDPAITCLDGCGSTANNCGDLINCGFVNVPPVTSPETTFGSGPGSGGSQFAGPYNLTVSVDELTAYVADYSNNRVSVWSRRNRNSTVWGNLTRFGSNGSGQQNFARPSDIALSADELTMWVSDYNNNRVMTWTRPNDSSQDWTGISTFSTGVSTGPNAVTLSSDELTMWVVEYAAHRVSVWARADLVSAWAAVTTFGTNGTGIGNLKNPSELWVSADTLTVWVSDSGNNRISVWSRPDLLGAWTNIYTIGALGTNDDQFTKPYGVALSADERTLWVADTGNNRISIWSRPDAASQVWTPLWRFGSAGSAADQFNTPDGIVLSADGSTIWIADRLNQRMSLWSQTCPA